MPLPGQAAPRSPWRSAPSEYWAGDWPSVALAAGTPDLEIEYCARESGHSRRRISPERLSLLRGGQIAMVAHCHLRNERRCFALDSILACRTAEAQLREIPDLQRAFAPEIRKLRAKIKLMAGELGGPFAQQSDESRLQEGLAGPAGDPIEDSGLDRRAFAILLDAIAAEANAICQPAIRARQRVAGAMILSAYRRIDPAAGPERGAPVTEIDLPAWFMSAMADATAHERLSVLSRQAPLRDLLRQLWLMLRAHPAIGHDQLTVRLVVHVERERKGSPRLLFAIDEFWLRPDALKPSTLGVQIPYRIGRVAGATPASTASFARWVLLTSAGLYEIWAASPEDAARKLTALGQFRPAIQEIMQPIAAEHRQAVQQAVSAMPAPCSRPVSRGR